MSKILLRRRVVSKVILRPASVGSRAVFLVEAQNRRERRQLQELFETVGELAEVAPLSDGAIMSYAVQVPDDPSLFSKIEALLNSQFCFSIVERSFSEVIYRMVESLCADSQSRLLPMSRCGICVAVDPFPTRISIRDERDGEIIEATYCHRCAARHADRSPKVMVADLLAADRRDLLHLRNQQLIDWRHPDEAPAAPLEAGVQTYAIAS